MTADTRELLPLYALGILDPDEASVVERAVAADTQLAAELAAYQQAAETLGAALPPVAPSPHVKLRLFASLGGGRFEKLSSRVAALFDVTVERARELLGLIERPASWVPQIPGISLVHLEGGPAAAAADCGFVRLAPGTVFPPHTHLGEEAVIVLAGKVHDPIHDRTVGPGEDYVQLEGTAHHLVCVSDEDCVFASRATNGIAVGGARVVLTKD